ncbi:DUF5067 domain-containing protein [Oceanobacillus picturae]|uniref:DUF5067 domain-containing protein n=1 Tax=Oceanobacillus picturae TaxID=171693 RepID=UPI00187BE637|nr:DUF5067 domain-containing protein [Oceanobacillus picturae]
MACGTDENDVSEADANTTADGETEVSEEKANDEEETEEAKVSDTSLDTGDYVYEIKETEQLDGKFDDDTQILAIELTFTNNSDEPTSPWMALGIKAEQETDVTVETLNGGNGQFPDDYKTELVEMGDKNIKPGATVDAVIGFEIMYPGEPVKLTEFSFDDTSDFERIVETK